MTVESQNTRILYADDERPRLLYLRPSRPDSVPEVSRICADGTSEIVPLPEPQPNPVFGGALSYYLDFAGLPVGQHTYLVRYEDPITYAPQVSSIVVVIYPVAGQQMDIRPGKYQPVAEPEPYQG